MYVGSLSVLNKIAKYWVESRSHFSFSLENLSIKFHLNKVKYFNNKNFTIFKMSKNSHNQNLENKDDSDDEPWTPEEDFNEVYIHLDENNNCIISGPPDKVNKLKEQIANIALGDGSIDSEKLKSITNFDFQVQ